MFSFKRSRQSPESKTTRLSVVSTSGMSGNQSVRSWQAVKCRKHVKQVVSNKPGVNDRSVINSRGNVSKFGAGLLLACRSFQKMMRRSFQLSGSYDLITSLEDLQAAILNSETPSIDGICNF